MTRVGKKLSARDKRKYRIRKKIFGVEARPRLTVYRSSKHIYAQAVEDSTGRTLVSASTLEKEVLDLITSIKTEEKGSSSRSTKSVVAARAVGKIIGKRCVDSKIESVVFDRNGYIFWGRVKAVADGARESGLKF